MVPPLQIFIGFTNPFHLQYCKEDMSQNFLYINMFSSIHLLKLKSTNFLLTTFLTCGLIPTQIENKPMQIRSIINF